MHWSTARVCLNAAGHRQSNAQGAKEKSGENLLDAFFPRELLRSPAIGGRPPLASPAVMQTRPYISAFTQKTHPDQLKRLFLDPRHKKDYQNNHACQGGCLIHRNAQTWVLV